MNRLPQRLAGAVFGASLLLACSLAQGYEAGFKSLVDGTTHQALFAVTAQGQDIYAVGAAGELLSSTDGGTKWTNVATDMGPLALLDVAVDDTHAIAVGQMGTVLVRGADGKWAKVDAGSKSRLFSVAVNSQGLAVAVGEFGTLLLSADGGQHWKSAAPDWTSLTKDGIEPHLYAAAITEDGRMTVAGELGLILQSTDAGASWSVVHQGAASIFALDIAASGTGYACGQTGTVLRTSDAGKSWQKLPTNSQLALNGIAFDDAGHVVVPGMHTMLVSRDGGASWGHVNSGDVGGAWYAGVVSVGQGDFLLVGHAGRVRRLTF